MTTGPPGPAVVCRALREAAADGYVADALLCERRQRDGLAIVDVHEHITLRLARGNGEAAPT
jgi:hypothetical protein